MSYVESMPGCCGMQELMQIHDDDDPLKSVMSVDPHDQAFIIFSSVKELVGGYEVGNRLARFIEKNKLGKVLSSNPAVNPNSKNHVKAFVWTINKAALTKFQTKIRKTDEDYKVEDPYYNPYSYTGGGCYNNNYYPY